VRGESDETCAGEDDDETLDAARICPHDGQPCYNAFSGVCLDQQLVVLGCPRQRLN